MTLCKHELKVNRTSLFIWCCVLSGMTALTMLLFPSFKDQMGTISNIFAMMGPFTAALGLDQLDFTTAIGFYGVESGTMLAVGGTLFAAFVGIGLLAKEESGHTAEFLLTQPISRARIVSEKLAAMVVLLVIFNAVAMATGVLCFVAIGETMPVGRFLLFHLMQFVLQLEIGCICLCVSAFARRSQVGIGMGIALLLYFLSLIVNMVDIVRILRYITPFSYAEPQIILTQGQVDGVLVAIGLLVMAASIAVTYLQYTRKDIAA